MRREELRTPCFVVQEGKLRRNLEILRGICEETGCKILLAQKAFSMYRVYPLIGKYLDGTTASGLYEARLGYEEMGKENHIFSPAYKEEEMPEILRLCGHIVFNSPAQVKKYKDQVKQAGRSMGLRINPECSTQEGHAIYDPCAPFSRLGTTLAKFEEEMTAEDIAALDGLHFHTLCEQDSDDLEKTLKAVEEKFGKYLNGMKWLNMGGGHLMTAEDYDEEELIDILRGFRARYPHLRIILEPGSAFTWRTGWLVATVEDIVRNGGVNTAMLNVSFACHMPDTLEMPYKPAIVGAHEPRPGEVRWRMGGNCCLAGDYKGDWAFDTEPSVGDRVVFEDMIHYTMVKTTMFNGVSHPSIAIVHENGKLEVVKRFGYRDFRDRMS